MICGCNDTDLPRRPADKTLEDPKTTIDPPGGESKPNKSQKANLVDLHLAELEDILAARVFQEPHEDSEDQSTTADPPGGELDHDAPEDRYKAELGDILVELTNREPHIDVEDSSTIIDLPGVGWVDASPTNQRQLELESIPAELTTHEAPSISVCADRSSGDSQAYSESVAEQTK